MFVDVIFVLFLLFSQHRSSLVSVVFDFSASLNDVAPVSPISLPVDVTRYKSVKRPLFHFFFDGLVTGLTVQIDFIARNNVHQKTDSLNRAFAHDLPCDK